MPRHVGELFGLLERIEKAHAPQMPGLVSELTRYVRGHSAHHRAQLEEAAHLAPRYQRRFDALREERDHLEDDLDALTTGEVELSVLAEHLKLLEKRESSLICDVRFQDIGVGD